jgi:hypothetical protein
VERLLKDGMTKGIAGPLDTLGQDSLAGEQDVGKLPEEELECQGGDG